MSFTLPPTLDFANDPPRTLREMEHWAKARAVPGAFEWLNSHAELGNTFRANRRAFEEWVALRPRVLRDVSSISLKTRFLGREWSAPFLVAPLGHLTQFHHDGEAELAAGTEGENTLLCISTQTRLQLSEVRARAPKADIAWQVYFYGDRDWVAGQVEEAKRHGAQAICVCVDAPIRPVRYPDMEIRYDGRKNGRRTQPAVPNTLCNAHTTWDDIAWLKEQAGDLPLLVKGIMTGEDAVLATAHGADVVWVSNHGARQLDSGLSTLEVLEEIRAAVGPGTPLVLDGGIRTGSDILKALALGADMVAIGRPVVFGLITAGAEGVRRTFQLFRDELEASMAMCGLAAVDQVGRNYVRTRW